VKIHPLTTSFSLYKLRIQSKRKRFSVRYTKVRSWWRSACWCP